MSKKQIYQIRTQTHNAYATAFNGMLPFSRLVRMEWKKSGYIPVSAYNI